MPSKKPQLNIRTDQELIDRIKAIAESEHRSMANQIEFILIKYAEEYEAKQKKDNHKRDLEKSSISRTG